MKNLLPLLIFFFISTGATFSNSPLSSGLIPTLGTPSKSTGFIRTLYFWKGYKKRYAQKSRLENSLETAFRVHRAVAISS